MNFFQFNFQFFASNPLRQNGCNTQVVKKCLWARAVKVKFSAQISPIFHFLVTFKNWISDIVTALVEFPFLLNFMVQFRKLQYSKVKLSQKKKIFFSCRMSELGNRTFYTLPSRSGESKPTLNSSATPEELIRLGYFISYDMNNNKKSSERFCFQKVFNKKKQT